jgi:hypothetical protein
MLILIINYEFRIGKKVSHREEESGIRRPETGKSLLDSDELNVQ